MHTTTLASHRFGFSETSLSALQSDPRGWVLAQFRSPAALNEQGLLGTTEIGPLTRRIVQAAVGALPGATASAAGRATALATPPAPPGMQGASDSMAPQPAAAARPEQPELTPDRQALRRANAEALQRRWQHVITTPTPVYERWVFFWSNHFCVAATKGATLGLVAPFEREAIRPHLGGSFRELLKSATLHPAMLLYLDNAQSIGPNSRAGRRRNRGLNENLARELLELHTLGVKAGYTQTDVTETAKLLTGWTLNRGGPGPSLAALARPAGMANTTPGSPPTTLTEFNPALHEPGDKLVLGRSFREGPEAVEQLFDELARHPATARFIATKLARHFVTDDPPAALVNQLAERFRATDGDLPSMAEALFSNDLAWGADTPPKFKRPEELLLSAYRVLKLPIGRPERSVQVLVEMGQPVGRAPSPQGWPDRSEDWLAPDALWKRVQWASSMGQAHAQHADARQLAALSFGPDLGSSTRQQIERADSGSQALALLLASPEFQRR